MLCRTAVAPGNVVWRLGMGMVGLGSRFAVD